PTSAPKSRTRLFQLTEFAVRTSQAPAATPAAAIGTACSFANEIAPSRTPVAKRRERSGAPVPFGRHAVKSAQHPIAITASGTCSLPYATKLHACVKACVASKGKTSNPATLFL